MLCIYVLTVVLLVQVRREIVFLSAVTAVLCITMPLICGLSVVLLVQFRWESDGSASSYCSTVTSMCYGYMDCL